MATLLRSALWLLLGGWVGAWVLFAAVVAPTAFAELPSAEVAGRVVGPTLGVLHRYGVGAGVALAIVALALGRGWPVVAIPLVLAALCGINEYGITAAIQEVRPLAFGGGDAEAAPLFGRLHRASVVLYGIVGAGLLLLTGLHARADAGPGRAPSRAAKGA